MAAVQFFFPFDIMVKPGNLGTPGGLLYFYLSGTTTLAAIHADSGLSVPLENPVECDGAGRIPAVYLDNTATYRLYALDKNGALLLDRDPYIPGEAPDSAALAPYQAAAAASATAASGSASAASGSATSAAASASDADASATFALGYRNDAQGFAGNASDDADAAALSAGQAATHEANAATDASNADTTKAAIQTLITGFPGSAGQTIPVATRSVAAAMSNPSAAPIYIYGESGAEDTWVPTTAAAASAALGSDPNKGVWFPSVWDSTKAFLRKPPNKRLHPLMFSSGIQSYNTRAAAAAGIDAGAALQAMFTFCKANPDYAWDLLGVYWPTSTVLSIENSDFDPEQSHAGIGYGGKIVSMTGSTGTDLIKIQAQYGQIHGILGAFGSGETSVTARGWSNLISLNGCGGLTIDGLEGGYARRQLVYTSLLNIDGSSGANNIGVKVGKVHGRYCGSAAGAGNSTRLSYAFDSVTLNGASNGNNQTSTLHFTTTIDPFEQVGDWHCYTETSGLRTAYQIASIDFVANTITYFLWFPSGVSSGFVDSARGGIVYISGSNTDNNHWGPINGENCGVILNDSGLYGAVVDYCSGDGSVGIHHIRGANTLGGGYFGGHLKAWHSEAAYLDEIESLGVSGYMVGPSSSRDTQGTKRFDLSYKSCPRLTGGARGSFQKKAATVHTPEDGWVAKEHGFTVSTDGALIPAQTFTIDNSDDGRFIKGTYPNSTQQTLSVTIDYAANYDALLAGKNWARLEVRGTETRGGIKVSATFQLTAALIAAGWTLNGGTAAIVHSQFKGPSVFFIKYDVSHKSITLLRKDHEPESLFGTELQTGSVTLSPGTNKKGQIFNSPLGAVTTVTLSTTGDVKDGDHFTISRTAAATGASALNVGPGPLASLAAGQSCRVKFSSALGAWVLA